MIVCEANSLSTTNLPRRAIAHETSKVKERIGLLIQSMASATLGFIMSLSLPMYHGCKPTMVLKINV